MKLGLVVLVCVATAAPVTESIDKYLQPPTVTLESNDTVYLKHAHRASLNFACNVDRITVTPNFDSIAVGFDDAVTQMELEDHLGEPLNIEWAHVMQMYFSSIDPRGQERQLGTLGGDLGEFLIVLAAAESETGVKYGKAEVYHQFVKYLTLMSKDKFYFATDVSGIRNFKDACHCPQLNIADPPDAKKAILLNATRQAASHGDEFFNKVLSDPEAYGIRAELVHSVVESFFQVMWKKESPLHRRIKFVLLKGDLAPKAFVMVKTPGYCNAQLLAPLISPELCAKQMGVYHGDASVLLRTEMAGILMTDTPEDKNGIVRKANELAGAALGTLLADHNEPVYTVAFEGLP